jgi:Protein of unknown function (DUF2735)
MTTNLSGSPHTSGSAQIFAFPPRGRFAATGQTPALPVNTQLLPAVKIASGSAWYHDEAVQAEQRRNS